MTKDAVNKYTSIGSARSVTSVTLEASNGDIVDGSGASVVLGGTGQGPDYYFSDDDEPVDRIKDATPTGNLEVDSNGNIIVDGHGQVTLTNAWNGREINTVGGANGLAGSLEVDSNGNLISNPPDMTYTYTSDETRVSNGNTTSHDTTNVASPIVIETSQIRWQGVDVTDSSTNTYVNSNSTVRTGENISRVESSYPTKPSGSTFDDHDLILYLTNNNDYSVTITYDVEDGFGNNVWSNDGTLNAGESVTRFLEAYEDGYDPDATAAFITADNEPGIEVNLVARTIYEETTSTTYNTKDPSVSGDVSASYSGTLSDGGWTSFITLSGFSAGANYFDHSISESNKADFVFEYDYHYDTMTVTLYNQ